MSSLSEALEKMGELMSGDGGVTDKKYADVERAYWAGFHEGNRARPSELTDDVRALILGRCQMLETAVDRLLGRAYDELLPASDETINWGDLGCTVEYVVHKHGDFYQVTIEEAAPGCQGLIGFIREGLSSQGIEWASVIAISTEW